MIRHSGACSSQWPCRECNARAAEERERPAREAASAEARARAAFHETVRRDAEDRRREELAEIRRVQEAADRRLLDKVRRQVAERRFEIAQRKERNLLEAAARSTSAGDAYIRGGVEAVEQSLRLERARAIRARAAAAAARQRAASHPADSARCGCASCEQRSEYVRMYTVPRHVSFR
jgi:hypothetical protein